MNAEQCSLTQEEPRKRGLKVEDTLSDLSGSQFCSFSNQSINQLTSQFQKPVLDPGEAEADVQDPGKADEAKKPWPVVREEGLQTYRGMGTVFSCTSAS